MKKIFAILIIFLAAGLLITCDMGASWSDPNLKVPPKPGETPEPPFVPPASPVKTLVIDKAQWTDDWYGRFTMAELGAVSVTAGQTYNYTFTFVPSRAMEEGVHITIADIFDADPWWTKISDDEITPMGPIAKGQSVTVTGSFTINSDVGGTGGVPNLEFQDKKFNTAPKKGTSDPVTLYFTTFTFGL